MAVTDTALDFNPPYLHPDYKFTIVRSPEKRLVELPRGWFHMSRGPAYGRVPVRPGDNDLTNQHAGRPQGQRIVLSGRVLDSDGRPAPNVLIEIWQANAAGRYVDQVDLGFMPIDPNFTGAGRTITDSEGRYSFRTIMPAAYAGLVGGTFRPMHIHVSLIGTTLSQRLITQCYFEGDPLIKFCPIVNAITDPRGVDRLIAKYNWDKTDPGGPENALAYDWDIVLRGPAATPLEN